MRALGSLLAIALLVGLWGAPVSPAVATQPHDGVGHAVPSARVPAGTGAITGRVLPEGDSSWRGERVEVTARPVDTDRGPSTTFVSGKGDYVLDGLPPGTYVVYAYRDSPGYRDSASYPGPVGEDPAHIVVASKETVTGIDFTLDLGAVITGRVTDDRGRPVGGVGVVRSSFVGGGSSGGLSAAGVPLVRTDARGRFVMRKLTAGVHRVSFLVADDVHVDRVWPGVPLRRGHRAVELVIRAHDAVEGVDVVLPTGGAVSGRLRVPEPDRPAYRFATAYVRDHEGWSAVEERPTRDGRYLVGGLDSGAYRLCFSPAQHGRPSACVGGADLDTASAIRVRAGDVTVRNYVGTALASVRGRVLVEGQDPSELPTRDDILAQVYRLTPRGYELAGGANADAHGLYHVGSLSPGTYRVGFIRSGDEVPGTQEFWPDAGSVEEAADLRLRPGDDAIVDADLDAGAQIAGAYLDEDEDGGRAAPTAFRRTPDGRWVPVAAGSDDDVDGYRITGLRPGTYRLGFGADPQWFAGSVPVFWPGSPTLAGASDIVLESLGDRVEGRDVDVDPGSVISGRVRGFGDTYESGDVVAYRLVDDAWVEERRTQSTWRLDGRFALAGLPAGTYRVAFMDSQRFWATGFHGPGDPRRLADATDVSLAADQLIENIDIKLTAKVRNPVRGRVAGRARVGSKLRVRPGVWSPTGTVLTYQWYSGSRPVRGATGTRYRLRPRDRGKQMTVVTTGSRGKGWRDLSAATTSSARVRGR